MNSFVTNKKNYSQNSTFKNINDSNYYSPFKVLNAKVLKTDRKSSFRPGKENLSNNSLMKGSY